MTIGVEGPELEGLGAVTLGTADRALATAAVKAVLRIQTGDEDALIAAFAESALGLAEQFTGQASIARAMTDLLPVSGAWQLLAAAPVRSISAVAAIDAAGVATALPTAGYAIDIDAEGDGWVRVIDAGSATRISVGFVAGMADGWGGLPPPLRQGVVLLAAHLFTARDASEAPPAAVTALWRPFRAISMLRRRAC